MEEPSLWSWLVMVAISGCSRSIMNMQCHMILCCHHVWWTTETKWRLQDNCGLLEEWVTRCIEPCWMRHKWYFISVLCRLPRGAMLLLRPVEKLQRWASIRVRVLHGRLDVSLVKSQIVFKVKRVLHYLCVMVFCYFRFPSRCLALRVAMHTPSSLLQPRRKQPTELRMSLETSRLDLHMSALCNICVSCSLFFYRSEWWKSTVSYLNLWATRH